MLSNPKREHPQKSNIPNVQTVYFTEQSRWNKMLHHICIMSNATSHQPLPTTVQFSLPPWLTQIRLFNPVAVAD